MVHSALQSIVNGAEQHLHLGEINTIEISVNTHLRTFLGQFLGSNCIIYKLQFENKLYLILYPSSKLHSFEPPPAATTSDHRNSSRQQPILPTTPNSHTTHSNHTKSHKITDTHPRSLDTRNACTPS